MHMLIVRRRPNLSDQESEQKATCGGGNQRECVQESGGRFRHSEFAHQRGKHDGIKHDVERIEHPA